jgi:F-type H+-transporting ATPase subunit a
MEAAVVGVITAILIALAAFLLTRRLSVIPSRTQMALEMIVQGLDDFVQGIVGPDGRRYVPVIATVFIYIFAMNLSGLVPGWASPTANINVTVAMALSVMLYVWYHAFRANGFVGFFKHFWGEPAWLGPLNLLVHGIGELARILSLSLRLFGNIFGEDAIIVILIGLAPFFLPIQFPMVLFAIFTALVQALVFTILTCVYITLWTAHGDHEGHEGHHDEHGVSTPSIAVPV